MAGCHNPSRRFVKIRIGDSDDNSSLGGTYMEAHTRTCHRTRNPHWVITAHLPQYEAYCCNMQIAVQDSCSACSYTSILTACPHAT